MSIAKYSISVLLATTCAGAAACATETAPEPTTRQFPQTMATSRYTDDGIRTELRDARQDVVAELHWHMATGKAGITLPGQGLSRAVHFDANVAPSAEAANEMANRIWEQESSPGEKPLIDWAYCCYYVGSGGSSYEDYACDWMPWWCFDCPC
jgi:hypothetical protein